MKLIELPAEGRRGRAPRWPLPRREVAFFVEGMRVPDEAATDAIARREAELWKWAWSTPQAVAWSMPSESWRLHTIAMWVRTFVLCESSEATAADKGSLHRFADQIGMTPAGLKENSWAIAADVVSQKRAERTANTESPAARPVRRLRAVKDA